MILNNKNLQKCMNQKETIEQICNNHLDECKNKAKAVFINNRYKSVDEVLNQKELNKKIILNMLRNKCLSICKLSNLIDVNRNKISK